MLASASGISVSTAGLILIGGARILFMLALFLVVERATRSARIAGIGCAFYAAAPNFVFWSGQYAYESIALPLLVGVLAMVVGILDVEADDADPGRAGRRRHGLAVIGGLGILAIAVTHHVTSLAAIVLLAGVLLAMRRGRAAGSQHVLALAALAVVATAVWLSLVARDTFSYIGTIASSTADSVFGALSRAEEQRQQGQIVVTPPVAERGVEILGLGVLLALTILGLRAAWRRRADPVVPILLVLAVAYFASLGPRLAPGAWEVGNRLSSLLFVGLVVVVGLGAATVVDGGDRLRLRTAVVAVAAGLAATTGVIAGWPTDLRLPWTYRTEAEGATLDSQPVAVARWFRDVAPPRARVLANEADGRTLPVLARVDTYAGREPYVTDILDSPGFPRWQVERFAQLGLGFAVVDRRSIGTDNMRGYYFPTSGDHSTIRPAAFVGKFDATGGSRIADSGDIAVYDLRSVVGATP